MNNDNNAWNNIKSYFSSDGKVANDDDEANDNSSMLNKIKSNIKETIKVETNYKTFFIILAVGVAIILLSLITLSVIWLNPHYFVSLFSLGSLICLFSFVFIYGTFEYISMLFSKERVIFTICYAASLLIGLYFSFYKKDYLWSLIASLVQMVTLIIFVLSFIPGGRTGISFITGMLMAPLRNLIMKFKGESFLPI